ncbi:tRNA(Ile2) 2-agmatinylcytidine synthetase TiaS [uncultured archaeon]|nr:tRNA(Ile2) 2-agmatinylcytidine synthetase TiaS [uncultured archaeon]
MRVGIDDTDSKDGMCTTYLAALLQKKLGGSQDPALVRLNPNIPYKTRGNAALALTLDGDPKAAVLAEVRRLAHVHSPNTQPGVAFLAETSKSSQRILTEFYRRTVSEHVTIDDAQEVANKAGIEVIGLNGGRGIVGAVAALGFTKDEPHTWELLAYRSPENCGKKRRIDEESVIRMDSLALDTFGNVDPESGRVLIAPHGPDPVLYGVRGLSREAVEEADNMVSAFEPVEFKQVFFTNQGTDAHLRMKKLSEVLPYDNVCAEVVVSSSARVLSGGHVVLGVSDGSGSLDVAAYRQSGRLRDVLKGLGSGDRVVICGGVGKYVKTINLEKIGVLSLEEKMVRRAPVCCGKSMTSAGSGKGFKCKKCGKKAGDKQVSVRRDVLPGWYEADVGARRHLSKPLIR